MSGDKVTQLSDKLSFLGSDRDSISEENSDKQTQKTQKIGDPLIDPAKDTPTSAEDVKGTHESDEEKLTETQEIETLHEVKGSETLNSIAAAYNTTPSLLAQHNRLTSRLIFPGQKLRVPPEKKKEEGGVKGQDEEPLQGYRKMEKPKAVIYKEEAELIDSQFVRVNVRHITDGKGIVSGSLLLTPEVLMFNPSLNDPLVQENEGPDCYQLVTPAELIVNFAILKDFVKFKTNEETEVDESLIFRPPSPGDQPSAAKPAAATDRLKEMFGLGSSNTSEKCDSAATSPTGGQPEGGTDPMYLRLLMGKPIAKKLPRTAPIISYGEQSLEAQYWFITTPAKAAHLYAFIRENFLEDFRYGRLNENAIMRNGYELLREGTSLLEAEPGMTCNRETVKKQMHKTLTVTSVDFAEISDMIGDSELIDFDERLTMARVMPPRTDGHNWVLKFTTATDGFNLNSFVRKMESVDGPVLILIADCSEPESTFGAFLSETPNTFSESFRGTGETFVFKLRPSGFVKYPWTGENNYFFRLTQESLIVGSGDGTFAIWIDSDLYKGRTRPCSTFDNEQLGSQQDFTIKVLECWAFEIHI